METSEINLDAERQVRARQYARIRRRLWAGEMVLGGIYLCLWVAMGWAVDLRYALSLRAFGGALPSILPWWVQLLLMGLIIFGPWTVLTLPLSYYTGFILPHRFGLSTQTLRGWISDLIKSSALSLLLGIPLLLGFYVLMRLAPMSWWFWAAAGFTLFTAVLSAIAPILLMPIFYTFKPLEDEHEDLVERLMRLAQKAGTDVQGVFTFDMSRRTRAANAALTGMSRTRRIILGDTLITSFTPDEIETVLAHELAHHVHRDIPFILLIQTAFNFGAFFLANLGMDWAIANIGLTSYADPAGLPFLALLFGIVSLLAMPIVNAILRWRESMADAYALSITRKPKAFASAMTRLANQNLADADPERWVVLLFHSHPPLKDRIERAQAFSPSID